MTTYTSASDLATATGNNAYGTNADGTGPVPVPIYVPVDCTDLISYLASSTALDYKGDDILATRMSSNLISSDYNAIMFNDALTNGILERVYVSTVDLNLGTIIDDTNVSMTLWNAFMTKDVTISELDASIDGITIMGLAVGQVIKSAQRSPFKVSVSVDGTPAISGKISIVTDEYTVYIYVTGTRGALKEIFNLPPKGDIVEKMVWNTLVLTAIDGSEQRIQLTKYPYYDISYSPLTEGKFLSFMEGRIFSLNGNKMAFPLWSQAVYYPGTIKAGVTEIDLDTSVANWQENQYYMIFKNPNEFQTGQVNSATATSITLSAANNAEWTGVIICPVIYGYIQDDATLEKYAMNAAAGTIEFTSKQTRETSEDSSFATYKDLPICNIPLIVDDTMSYSFSFERFEVNLGIQPPVYYQKSAPATVVYSANFIFSEQSEVIKFKKFLYYVKGPQDPFWLLTTYQDIFPIAGLSSPSDSSTIYVTRCGIAESYFKLGYRTHIAVKYASLDDWVYYEVTAAVTQSPDDVSSLVYEKLTLSDSLGYDFSLDKVTAISILLKVRVSSNTVTFTWTNLYKCSVSLTLQEVLK